MFPAALKRFVEREAPAPLGSGVSRRSGHSNATSCAAERRERECGRPGSGAGGAAVGERAASGGAEPEGGRRPEAEADRAGGDTPAGTVGGGTAGGGGGIPHGRGGAGEAPAGGGGGSSRGSGGSAEGSAPSCTRSAMQAKRLAHGDATSMTSITSLRQTLASSQRSRGKIVILISGGCRLDACETTLMASGHGSCRGSRDHYTILVPSTPFSADRRALNFRLVEGSVTSLGRLEKMASMSGGGTFRADVNADKAFRELRREPQVLPCLVEKDPGDATGKARRMKAVSRRLAVGHANFSTSTYEHRDGPADGSALESRWHRRVWGR